MTFEDLMDKGRKLSKEHVQNDIKALAQDERFPAVLQLVARLRDSFRAEAANRNIAHEHGPLAHVNGSAWGCDQVLAALKQAFVKTRKVQERGPEEES